TRRAEGWEARRANTLRVSYLLRGHVTAFDALYVAAERARAAALVRADGPLARAPGLGVGVHNLRASRAPRRVTARALLHQSRAAAARDQDERGILALLVEEHPLALQHAADRRGVLGLDARADQPHPRVRGEGAGAPTLEAGRGRR